jgi:molecular chaperone DnaJ
VAQAQREWFEKDFYKVLGVSEKASRDEIRKAYRKLSKELHPDSGGDEERFKEVSAAYDVLGDEAKRKEYDDVRKLGPMGNPFGGGGGNPFGGGGPGGFTSTFRVDDLGDLLGGMFGRGGGIVHRPRKVKVRIPPGVLDGQRIRLKGRGAAGANGGPSGDLYVTVRVGGHRLFGRKGKDLTLTVPVTFPEAVLGAEVKVPTLDAPVTLRIPPGTPTGKTFRVRGRGTPVPGGFGDLLVTVEVVIPSPLTDEQRAAVEALAAAIPDSPRKHLGVDAE